MIWSIGNEIPERAEARGVELARQVTERIKSIDPTRPVAAAINGIRFSQSGEALDPPFRYLGVSGYNYMPANYEADHARHPERVIVGTDSFPRQAFESWQPVEKQPYVIGDFVWTAMDHLGESAIGNAQLNTPGFGGGAGGPGTPGGQGGNRAGTVPGAAGGGLPGGFGNIRLPFPWFNCYCGDIDLIGELKPQGHYRRVLWGRSKLEMAVQRPLPEGRTETITPWGWSDELHSWTWPGYEGKVLKVRVFSPGEQVRLLLNGKEIAVKPVSPETQLRAEFDVPYAAGELKAIALEGGKPVAEIAFQTCGKPAKLRLKADRAKIRKDRNDLSFATLEVLDAGGNLVPDAAIPVSFTIDGAGSLAATGTANPKRVASFRKTNLRTYHGKALAIVRPKGVRAQAAGLAAATAVVQVT